MINNTINKQIQELKNKIIELNNLTNGNLYFAGRGQVCRMVLQWFKEEELDLPVAICDDSKMLQGRTYEGVNIISFEEALENSNSKFIITDLKNSDSIYQKLEQEVSSNQVFKIEHYLEVIFNHKNQLQEKIKQIYTSLNNTATEEEKINWHKLNKEFIYSLRGLNDEKFSLLTPDDMPQKAKEVVNQLKYIKDCYYKKENFYLDSKNNILLQDFCSKNYYKDVYRLGDYQSSHLVERELGIYSEKGLKFNRDLNYIKSAIENVTQFNKYLKNKNIPFMYMQLPCKISPNNNDLPRDTPNMSNIKADEFILGLKKKNVNVFDYRKFMIQNNIDFLDNFFKTDTHWKPSLAFSATIKLLEEIKKLINIEIDEDKITIENYNKVVYPNIFLGSQGKKTGILFSGLDDFELILPKYETDYTWHGLNFGLKKRGTIKEALLYPSQLCWEYNLANPYAVYNLLNASYTIIENHKSKSNLKILCINDSFSNPIASFLAPHFSELHFFDLRGNSSKKELFEIIDYINPDIVVMLYTTFSFNIVPSMTDINPNIKYNN